MLPLFLALALGDTKRASKHEISVPNSKLFSKESITLVSHRQSGALVMFRIKVALALMVVAATIATATEMAQDNSSRTLRTHQIDRFEAIRLLGESLKSNPNDTAALIVVGELAHEVAQDLSSVDDELYYKLSLEAYQKALSQQPDNAGLKAAVDFAREQQAGAAEWDLTRRKAASTYIEVRKHELAASGFNPTVQVYSPPASASAATSQPAETYRYPVYQPYYVQGAQPFTYQQYAGSYLYTAPYNTNGTVTALATRGAHRRRSER
jgi:hypothetical protein